jgi:hypothetical protein
VGTGVKEAVASGSWRVRRIKKKSQRETQDPSFETQGKPSKNEDGAPASAEKGEVKE